MNWRDGTFTSKLSFYKRDAEGEYFAFGGNVVEGSCFALLKTIGGTCSGRLRIDFTSIDNDYQRINVTDSSSNEKQYLELDTD